MATLEERIAALEGGAETVATVEERVAALEAEALLDPVGDWDSKAPWAPLRG